ncbi:MAG: DUF1643 domain-containing protein [Anaerolineae bacterium]|nr:DUF1643 domain-containing protein [Anaerolineae bacterium]
MKTTAVISSCQQYRYELRRVWDEAEALVLFVCLNPSVADGELDDHTSRVCIQYARRWGYGGLIIGNLFAYRSTNPAALYQVADPVGPENDAWLRKLQKEAALTVCAWGARGAYQNRDETVLTFLRSPHCLVKLKDGRPGHPLYKRADLQPIPL